MNHALTAEVDLISRQRLPRWALATLWGVTIAGIVFVAFVALPYFNPATLQSSRYWPRRWWLLLHVATGIVALLSGPVQLWLGLTERRVDLHRRFGVIYLCSVVTSSLAAYYLAFNTDFGFVFGAGLTSLATAWLLTTGLAVFAIRRHLYEQHKEWMIRSYVVTTAFITFRLFFKLFELGGVRSPSVRAAAMAWFCWAVPLLFTEAILQGRKMTKKL